jgi:hypothetical protein
MLLRRLWLGGFHQREADWRGGGGGVQLSTPKVEGVFAEFVVAAEGSDALAAALLLCDSLAPQIAPRWLFGSAHFSTMRREIGRPPEGFM